MTNILPNAILRKKRFGGELNEDVYKRQLIDRLFDGSADKLFASLLGRKRLTPEQLKRLRAMIEEDE